MVGTGGRVVLDGGGGRCESIGLIGELLLVSA